MNAFDILKDTLYSLPMRFSRILQEMREEFRQIPKAVYMSVLIAS